MHGLHHLSLRSPFFCHKPCLDFPALFLRVRGSCRIPEGSDQSCCSCSLHVCAHVRGPAHPQQSPPPCTGREVLVRG